MKTPFKSLVVAAALGLAASSPVNAAQFVLVNTDPVGAGFNDPTPATPVGGNPGRIVGDQRLIAYSRVLQLWGSVLKSDVPIAFWLLLSLSLRMYWMSRLLRRLISRLED